MRPPSVRVERRTVHDLTDTQIETLVSIGTHQGELVEQLQAAVREGDRETAWRISEELVKTEDEARRVTR